jgi:DNA repair exonuclease SbcCD ATPase subunit
MSTSPNPIRLKTKTDLALENYQATINTAFDPPLSPARQAAIEETKNIKLAFDDVKKTFEASTSSEVPSPMASRPKIGRSVTALHKTLGERLREEAAASETSSPSGNLSSTELEQRMSKDDMHKLISLEVKNAALETKITDLVAQLESLEAASARLKEFEQENTKALISRNETLKVRNATLEAKLLQAAEHFEKLSNVHTKVINLEKVNNSLSSSNSNLAAELKANDRVKSEASKEVTTLQQQIAKLQKLVDAEKSAQSLIALEKERDQALETLFQNQSKLAEAKESFRQLELKQEDVMFFS